MNDFIQLRMGEQASWIVYPVILLPFLVFLAILILVRHNGKDRHGKS